MITITISNPDEDPLAALARLLVGLRSQWWRRDSRLIEGDRVIIRDSNGTNTIKVFEIADSYGETNGSKETAYP